jgi:cyclophilin family peptidyl-prolyl cis-trans isomerase
LTLTLDPNLYNRAEWLDGRHVVFGKVVDGLDMLKKVADKFGSESGIPNSDIYIGESSVE